MEQILLLVPPLTLCPHCQEQDYSYFISKKLGCLKPPWRSRTPVRLHLIKVSLLIYRFSIVSFIQQETQQNSGCCFQGKRPSSLFFWQVVLVVYCFILILNISCGRAATQDWRLFPWSERERLGGTRYTVVHPCASTVFSLLTSPSSSSSWEQSEINCVTLGRKWSRPQPYQQPKQNEFHSSTNLGSDNHNKNALLPVIFLHAHVFTEILQTVEGTRDSRLPSRTLTTHF